VHEHIARAMYYFSVHLLHASAVGLAAWALTSIRGASATTKYWMWVVAAFNFVFPVGALIDRLWAPHLTWAHPLGAIGEPIWIITGGRTGIVLGVIWAVGTTLMLARLLLRIRAEHRANRELDQGGAIASVTAAGIPVAFGHTYASPAVMGILAPKIVFPLGVDRILSEREFDAVLQHELVHARRRDNLIRLLYEISLCILWFHPLIWLTGARIALYRELSCDESVIRHAQGQALLSALAKLSSARPALLQAAASSQIGDRLAALSGASQMTSSRTCSIVYASFFAAAVVLGVYQTIAHTACCFLLHR
jgi:beta-lactamase regulating signal transducer with metallopeptidase domain